MKNDFTLPKYAVAAIFLMPCFSCKKDITIGTPTKATPPLAEVNIETALNIARVFNVPASVKGVPPNNGKNTVIQPTRPQTTNGLNNSTPAMVDALDFSKKIIDMNNGYPSGS